MVPRIYKIFISPAIIDNFLIISYRCFLNDAGGSSVLNLDLPGTLLIGGEENEEIKEASFG